MTRQQATEILRKHLAPVSMGVCDVDVDAAMDIAAAERERCAKLVENMERGPLITEGVKTFIARAIRASH